ncbi:NnrS family protein [Desertibaculum subflavum]|uniref:NnrS family protein n=1 Tax=Desertibaculum subflavum TaxID=2268458 RepID=UPI000E6725AB
MATIRIEEPLPQGRRLAPTSGFMLFAYGFRPFFLAAGIYPPVALMAWIGSFAGWWSVGGDQPMLWHGHEMMFGFLAAAFAGFLLTAVPNWTGTTRLHGAPLAGLFALWLAGRVVMWLPDLVPPVAQAAVDLAFLPALALAIGLPVFTRSRARNGAFIVLPLAFAAANAAYHAAALGFDIDGLAALHVAIDLMLVALTVIGGRIVPGFTQSGLRMAGNMVTIAAAPWLDRAAILSIMAVVAVDLIGLDGQFAAAILCVAVAIHAARLLRWQGWLAWRLPLVWVLHVAYLWLVAGLALRAAGALGLVPAAAGLHAITAGAMATMIVAVMTRASLGHTGRLLQSSPAIVAIYLLVIAGALGRVLSALAPGESYLVATVAAAALWALGFLLFAIVYFPVLVGPRADGREG